MILRDKVYIVITRNMYIYEEVFTKTRISKAQLDSYLANPDYEVVLRLEG